MGSFVVTCCVRIEFGRLGLFECPAPASLKTPRFNATPSSVARGFHARVTKSLTYRSRSIRLSRFELPQQQILKKSFLSENNFKKSYHLLYFLGTTIPLVALQQLGFCTVPSLLVLGMHTQHIHQPTQGNIVLQHRNSRNIFHRTKVEITE